MAVVVGIDEAGYGPLLGPLVISSVTFSLPDEHLKSDMWHLLGDAVGKGKRQLAGRLLITDSKKAYSKSAGLGHLRRAVLAGLSCCSSRPKTAGELLKILCPECVGRLSDYPWYQGLDAEKIISDDSDMQIASDVLKKTLLANKMELLGMSARCLDVGCYNQMVSVVRNKASVLFTAVCGLISTAFQNVCASDNLQIIVDRQGGRVGYTQPLRRMFSELDLRIIHQDQHLSSYELTGRGKKMRIHFPVKADSKFLPVSLASMTSKYIRQLLIGSINQYFTGHYKKLKPTAGYWQDGLRFIKDLEENIPGLIGNRKKLIRSR